VSAETRSSPVSLLVFNGVSICLALGVVVCAIWIANLNTGPTQIASAPPDAPLTAPQLSSGSLTFLTVSEVHNSGDDVLRFAEIHTVIPNRPRYRIDTYTVAKNDTLFTISKKFNLDPETLVGGNARLYDNPNLLSIGQVLNILPVDGALRVVLPNDTLEKIAKAFHIKVEDIVQYPGNELDADNPQIKEGQNLILPGGWRESITWSLPVVTRKTVRAPVSEPGSCAGPFSGPTGSYTFIYPTDDHSLSGTDYLPNSHPGLDFRAPFGVSIYASDSGVVVFSGLSTRGYGNLVIVDHGNGWQTAYAHLSRILAGCGQGVSQGAVIGLSGSTGNSTGAHLHFEMRHSEYGRVNPWSYLP